MRRTKIVCTLGPATNTVDMIKQLLCAGMDVARFNFSHSTHEEHHELLARFRQAAKEMGKPAAALLDTKGPEIRLGNFQDGKVYLKQGERFTLTTEEILGDKTHVSISYPGLVSDLEVGRIVLLDDGLVALKVVDLTETEIICRVLNDGPVSNHKGVNVPGTRLSMPYISQKDHDDIVFGVKEGFDFIAASFVRCADDILQIRKILDECKCDTIRIIAKIENAEGVDNIDEILMVADGVMVARGDMGVEIPLEDVPILQKRIISKAYNAGKQVITATQMLDSMIKNPRPTRAEATDVANAIYDGTSAIMLSGETAAGAYPVEAVKTMARIAERTERDVLATNHFKDREDKDFRGDVTNAISHATCTTAHDLGAAAIITVTLSGHTARMISKYRPEIPIIGCTPSEHTYRHMCMSWGVTPIMVEEMDDMDDLFEHVVTTIRREGVVSDGELVVITLGAPLSVAGTTNLIKVQIIGDVLASGDGIGTSSCVGTLCVAKNEEEAHKTFTRGDILVIPQTSNQILDIMKQASAIITEEPGINSHAATIGMALDIPVIVGCKNATHILKGGTCVNVDAARGFVCNLAEEK
ncbi:MAG TPA: pyruvate kinase [Firmicutes bacterium]|nr:pyruvate kinase [Bacillota bacterium]